MHESHGMLAELGRASQGRTWAAVCGGWLQCDEVQGRHVANHKTQEPYLTFSYALGLAATLRWQEEGRHFALWVEGQILRGLQAAQICWRDCVNLVLKAG